MNAIAMVTISEELCFRYIPKFLLRYIPSRIVDFLILRFKKIQYDCCEIHSIDSVLHIARLPFDKQQISLMSNNRITKYFSEIEDYCKSKQIKYLFISDKVQLNIDLLNNESLDDFIWISNDKTLFFTLVVDALKKICKTSGIEAEYLNVGIFEKNFSYKSMTLIKLISQYVKYINMITEEPQKAEDELEMLSEDTGLAVWVSDSSTDITNIDIIFMLDKLDNFEEQRKDRLLRKTSIIFDFTDSFDYSGKIYKNIIITNVELELPWDDIGEKLGAKDSIKLIQAILYSKLNIKGGLGIDEYKDIREEIYRLGCKIKKLKGKGIALNLTELLNI